MMKTLSLSLLIGSALLTMPVDSTPQDKFQFPCSLEVSSTISSPEQFLGYPLGEWHLRHDQLNAYLHQVAQQSPRAVIEQAGYSHEKRQQLSLVVTSEANQQQLDEILQQRAAVKQGQASKGPLVIWLAYSIHGDEASGAHAAMALSYYLSVSNEAWVKQLLDDAVVIITPSQNPDGMDRFATWANNNRSNTFNDDPNHREHHQVWPGGRLNHYLADLNRDWLFLRHPESQGRVALFHKWQPHYVGDFHEMGHNSSYFFQPGVPSRTHPLTPQRNQILTDQIANYHRQALDAVGQPYYSKQSFDDFFYGKGSTYPDINGAIGVLFEQASARGKAQSSMNGTVTLERAIQNQFATSISSLKGALAHKRDLHQYQTDFFADKALQSGKQKGWLVSASQDSQRRDAFVDILRQHQIAFSYLTQSVNKQGHIYQPQDSVFIPAQQPQTDLVAALFDQRTQFKDETFYDVSSFDMSAALDLVVATDSQIATNQLSSNPKPSSPSTINNNDVAVLIDWQQSSAAPFLQQLLAQQVVVKFTEKPFTVRTNKGEQTFGAGSLQVNLTQDALSRQELVHILQQASQAFGTQMTGVASFAAVIGGDLGSRDVLQVYPVKPLLISGQGTNPMEAGQLWNYLDNGLHMPVTLSDISRLDRIRLTDYSHILLVDGNYSAISPMAAKNIQFFVRNGGTLVAHKGALKWLAQQGMIKSRLFDQQAASALFDTQGLSFGDRSQLQARQTIGGAIANLDLDLTHPLNFGINHDKLKIMKKGILAFEPIDTPFVSAANYAEKPLASGFMAPEYQNAYPHKAAMIVEAYGKGRIVGFSDNLLFRNIWLGSEKIYANALFFVPSSM